MVMTAFTVSLVEQKNKNNTNNGWPREKANFLKCQYLFVIFVICSVGEGEKPRNLRAQALSLSFLFLFLRLGMPYEFNG